MPVRAIFVKYNFLVIGAYLLKEFLKDLLRSWSLIGGAKENFFLLIRNSEYVPLKGKGL